MHGVEFSLIYLHLPRRSTHPVNTSRCENVVCTVLYANVKRKGARCRLNRRTPVLEKPCTRGGRSGSPKGFQITKQVRTKSGTSRGNTGGLVVVHSTRVEEPENVDCHRVASLKAETKASTKDRRIGRPGKSSVFQRHCPGEGEGLANLVPDSLCQRAGVDEVL